ncbi:glycosyltransferase family 2 protein [Flavobacterium sp.]|uniref:glycosyltransferase family 2 protein n=1 Tax=Flavobacterium sp. TaxID=239 RepID=UPI00374D0786
MLSILIPTYNYSAFSLVQELKNQAIATGIIFEIIVLDDSSTDEISLIENSKINTLENCKFEKNETNVGRAKNLNKLAAKSQYNWLLFMDCDTFPKSKNFIATYINSISENNNALFGGITYKKEKPNKEKMLRWKYGSNREEITVLDRNKNPYSTTLTSNFLIKKEVFTDIKFDERIDTYGYEDLVFIQHLKAINQPIHHIDNPTYHLNYETSNTFLTKTKKALETLQFIEANKILTTAETKIQKMHQLISKMKLSNIIVFIFYRLQSIAEQNLLSKKPSLFVFDLYKLGYYATLKSKN